MNMTIDMIKGELNVHMKISKVFPTFIMLFSSVLYAAEPLVYVVRNGDTLSTIALKQIGPPIFRKDGSLSKLLKMNPSIHDADLIFPGQRLVIRSSDAQKLAAVKSLQKVPNEIPPRQLASSETSPDTTALAEATNVCENGPQKSATTNPKQFEIPHHLMLDATMGMTTLAGTDAVSTTGATLYSSQDMGVGIGWQQDWTDTFSTKFSAKFRSVDFQPPTSSTKSISDSKKFTTGLLLSAESKLTSKLLLNYGASYGQELFLRGLSSTAVGVDSVAVPKFSLGAIYQVYEVGKTSVGVIGDLDYLMGVTTDGYTVNSGMAYQGGFYLKRRYDLDKSVEFNISYRDRSQNTSIITFHEKTVFGTLVFSLPLFSESEAK